MENRDMETAIEAILFVSGEPVKVSRIAGVLDISEEDVSDAATRLQNYYSFERRGIRLVKLEDKLQLCSSGEYAEYIRRALETRKPPQLTQPALEVLAIVAYFGPVTKLYIEQIRGVDSAYTIGLLAERGLIEPCGRLSAPGRPMLYKTTHNFLRVFGLSSLDDLPKLPDVEGDTDEKESIAGAILELKTREAEMEAVSESEVAEQEQTQEQAVELEKETEAE